MQVTRVFAGPDGESHFENVQVPLFDAGTIGALSSAVPVREVRLRETPADYDYDWHRAPQRQFVVLLDGTIEIEVSDGEKRQFKGGDILLLVDTTGKGHRTRTTDGKSRRSIFITLDDDAQGPDVVSEAGKQSFPASDPPSWTGTTLA